MRIPDDGKIEWKYSAQYLHNFVRAQSSPYPGAFFKLDQTKIYVEKAAVYQGIVYGEPGSVFIRNHEMVVICCGEESALSLFDVRIENKHIPAASVIKSYKVRL